MQGTAHQVTTQGLCSHCGLTDCVIHFQCSLLSVDTCQLDFLIRRQFVSGSLGTLSSMGNKLSGSPPHRSGVYGFISCLLLLAFFAS